MRLSFKIFLGFVISTVVTVAIVAVSAGRMSFLAGETQTLYNYSYKLTTAVLKVETGMLKVQNALDEAMILEDKAEVEKSLSTVDGLFAAISAELEVADKAYLGDKTIIQELRSDIKNWSALVSEVKSAVASGKKDQVRELIAVKSEEILNELLSNVTPMIEGAAGRAEKFAGEAVDKYKSAATLVYGMLLAGVLMSTIVAWMTINSVVKPFKAMFGGLKTLSSKELSALTISFRDIIENLSSGGSQVAQASQQLAQGATEQAAGLEETSSSLEELASQTKQNADNAQQANQLSAETTKAALGGSDAMQRMNTAILEIQKSSEETSKIIKTIDEIAFQTNLLALNAAVEAARAGEAGKGFAVVAEEVRNLAMRSADAAKNTSAMIEDSVKNSNNGVQITNEVARSLSEITTSVQKVNDLVGEINSACQEQAQGIEQINISMSQMDKVTQSNAANAEESASAASQVMNIVHELQNIIGAGNNTGGYKAAEKTDKNTGKWADKKAVGKVSSVKPMSKADQAFHAIADGSFKADTGSSAPAKSKSAREAELLIPFENDGFDEFN